MPCQKPIINKGQLLDILQGYIFSLSQSADFLAIKGCMRANNPKTVEEQLGKISVDDEEFDLFQYMKNVKDLMLMEEFKQCQEISPELLKIKQWAQILENPIQLFVTLFFNILTNLHYICLDLIMIFEASFVGDYTGMGIHGGYLVSDALGPVPRTDI